MVKTLFSNDFREDTPFLTLKYIEKPGIPTKTITAAIIIAKIDPAYPTSALTLLLKPPIFPFFPLIFGRFPNTLKRFFLTNI